MNNIPDNLMDNVELNLRTHIKNKKRKNHTHRAVAAAIALLIILPGSTFAFAQYNDSIPYKQEIDLARENKNITEINKTFKYKNVQFTIKEIVADDTGMEVIYNVSDPKYSISKINFGDKDNKPFNSWGYSLSDSFSNNKEKAFCISTDNTASNYMHNNPITIKINNLAFNDDKKSENIIDKVSALIHPDSSLNVDWTMKMQVPMQQVKIIPVNKEYALDIGVLKINSFKVGVLKSVLDYNFVPNDKTIVSIHPLFSLRLDKEYIMSNGGYDFGSNSVETNIGGTSFHGTDTESNKGIGGTQEFSSIYYKKLDQIGIKLIGANVNYDFNNSNVYKIDKNKLPMEFDFNGEKFKITSMKQKGDSTQYTVAYGKTNRIYSELNLNFSK